MTCLSPSPPPLPSNPARGLDDTADGWTTLLAPATAQTRCAKLVRRPTLAPPRLSWCCMGVGASPPRVPIISATGTPAAYRAHRWPYLCSPPSHHPPPPTTALCPPALRLPTVHRPRTRSPRRIGEFDRVEALPAAAGHCSTPDSPPPPVSQQQQQQQPPP